MEKDHKIVYYGPDRELLAALERDFPNFITPGNKISFKQFEPDANHKVLCDLLISECLNLLLIDFSNNPSIDEALRILYYEIQIKKVSIIGLWNRVQTSNLYNWRFELGINTHFHYHIREPGSMESLILSISRLLSISRETFTFFQKNLSIPLEIYCPIRINFFDTESAQIESDIPFVKGEIISCDFPGLKEFPFNDFQVKSISNTNLNYPYDNQANLEYILIDEFYQSYKTSWDHLDDINFLDLLKDNPVVFKNLDEIQVKLILDQFSKNKSTSHARKVSIKRLIEKIGRLPKFNILKNIIVDPNFSTFKLSTAPLWSYGFNFFLIKSIEDNLNILNTCSANIVTYISPVQYNKNNFEESLEWVQLKAICARLNTLKENFNFSLPLVLIYNLDIDKEKLINLLNYKNLEVKKSNYDFNENIIFIKKYYVSDSFLQERSFYIKQILKIYPDSTSDISHGFLKKEVEILSISENEIIFRSKLSLKKNLCFMFKISGNLTYFATIYKIENNESGFIFFGILNSLSEQEKSELRKIVIKG